MKHDANYLLKLLKSVERDIKQIDSLDHIKDWRISEDFITNSITIEIIGNKDYHSIILPSTTRYKD